MTYDSLNESQMELVEIVSQPARSGLERWQPIIGQETVDLLNRFKIPQEERERVKSEAVSVLSKCVSPHAPADKTTGLVIGYVQSGKTMSFTTVTALARDNGYQMVIVIAGVSSPLLEQSTDRLKKDLNIDSRVDRHWKHFESKNLSQNDESKIERTLADWRDVSVPKLQKRTVLITVMKNHKHLKNLYEVLKHIKNLHQVPTLIIDDEADQASLNTKVNNGQASTTYQWIVMLKSLLPHHTFLQYTATPQAPLLISLIDVLSPQFAEVLNPGAGYIGGKKFFLESAELVRSIPRSEISTKENPLNAPPDSLLYAMRLYFLGVAAGFMLDEGNGNRSMMVHPSRTTYGHQESVGWIKKTMKNWLDILDSNSPDHKELLEDFEIAYNDLKSTVYDLPPFEKLVPFLPYTIRQTSPEEVNSRGRKTPIIDWSSAYPHILVGGQAMDRGFTVEGLTVTYMPRNPGVGNADTIQQRARFFGYKRDYQGYCRIFLENEVHESFKSYVRHEEDIRQRLIEHKNLGTPLTDWRRAFFLDRRLKPTRSNVLDLDYMRGNFSNQWYSPKAPHDSEEAIASNRTLVHSFLNKLSLKVDENHLSNVLEEKHKVDREVPLGIAFTELLVPLRLTRLVDSQAFTGLLLQIGEHIEYAPSATCTVYHMNNGKPRNRSTDDKDEIKQLFEGKRPKTGPTVYPGDREIKAKQGITLQVHNLNIQGQVKTHTNVPVVAIWLPQEMANDWLVQQEGTI